MLAFLETIFSSLHAHPGHYAAQPVCCVVVRGSSWELKKEAHPNVYAFQFEPMLRGALRCGLVKRYIFCALLRQRLCCSIKPYSSLVGDEQGFLISQILRISGNQQKLKTRLQRRKLV